MVKLRPPQVSARLDTERRRLVLTEGGGGGGEGEVTEYPWVWLRDNCQCSQCFESISQCRIINLTEWDLNVRPRSVSVTIEGEVEIIWEDGHRSLFDPAWLQRRSFSRAARQQHREEIWASQETWGSRLMDSGFPQADYEAIMTEDAALLDWLERLDRFGFVLVRNVPVREGPVPALQVRAGLEKMTHYGPGYTVVVRSDPANISHTHHRIFFHTDLTYYDYMPGTVFLHCIVQHQGEGGDTMLCDGYHCANLLREKYPAYYQLLSNTNTSFKDIGQDYIQYDKITQKPFLM